MAGVDSYLLGVLSQVLDSFKIIEQLKDKPGDLDTIKKELAKINGLLHVVIKKIENTKNESDKFFELQSAAKFYLDNYYFEREIETMAHLYSNDSDRLKNIRYSIIQALQNKKLIEKIESIIISS